MGRRKQASGPTVSLFPFLSILACVIGVLTLLITALAISQLDPAQVQKVEKELRMQKQRAEQAEALAEQIRIDQQLLDMLNQRMEQVDQQQAKLAELRRQAESLQSDLTKLAEKTEKTEAMQAALAKVNQELQNARERRDDLITDLESVRKELAERNKPPEPPKVVVRPSGSGVDLKPTFVECRASEVVIYDRKKQTRINRGELPSHEAFGQLLDRIAKAEKATIVFLLRDDGVRTYYTARNLAIRNYARNGKLPIVGDGPIDLSMFEPN